MQVTCQKLIALFVRQIYAYRRTLNEQSLIVALNNMPQVQAVELPVPGAQARVLARDVLNGDTLYSARNGQVTVELAPLWGAVLA